MTQIAVPHFIKPQLATLVKSAPKGTNWLHEIKFDGYRLLSFIEKDCVRLVSRSDQDWTRKFQILVNGILKLNLEQAILDGELVVLDDKGISRFQLLQNSLQFNQHANFRYYVFDILFYNHQDLRSLALIERKKILAKVLKPSSNGIVQLSHFVVGRGSRIYEESCKLGLEGIIAKRCNSCYQSSRNENWLKIKCIKQQEFVVGGYTDPQGSRFGLGALLVGYYENSKLHYCGKVGTGFNQQSLEMLLEKLRPLQRTNSPFDNLSNTKATNWVKPKLVVEVVFTEWTQDRRLRHPSFQGLREDKKAKEVHYE